jgi:hypothetical protein
MRFPVYEHDAAPGVTKPLLRKSYEYCNQQVLAGTHAWLPEKKSGIIALPPPKELDDSLLTSFEDNGALDESDSIHNATGAADEKRVALRPEGKLTKMESRAMAKVRSYGVDVNPATGLKGPRQPSWADRVRYAAREELAALQEKFTPSLIRALERGV